MITFIQICLINLYCGYMAWVHYYTTGTENDALKFRFTTSIITGSSLDTFSWFYVLHRRFMGKGLDVISNSYRKESL